MTPTTAPGIRPKAPEPLDVVQDFVNTDWLRTREEHLRDPHCLEDWLSGHALLDPESRSAPLPARAIATDADLELALRLRAAIRRMLAREPQAEQFPDLPILISLGDNGRTRAQPAVAGVPGALARILIAAWEAEHAGLLERLKLCVAPDCRWAYYDPSRNKSAVWCNMAVCGSRAKSRAYYQRQKASTPRTAP